MKITVGKLKRLIREAATSQNDLTTANGLARHVIQNWKKITGLPKSAMNEESHFPEQVEALCDQHGVDLGDFSEAFNAQLE